MRPVHPALLIAVGLFAIGSVRPASGQDCPKLCPREAQPGSKPTTGIKAMSATGLDAVRDEFNASSDKVRFVALLSPSCPGCRSGHAVLGRILKNFSSPDLRAILVWEPMRSDDSPAAATQQADAVRDSRIWQGWNGNKQVGDLFGNTLHIHGTAWDVYLLYNPGIRWEKYAPPPPTFWMHQLQGVDPKLLLCVDPARLNVEVGKLLDNLKEAAHGG